MDMMLARTLIQQDAARWLKAGVVPRRTCLCTHSPAAGPQLSSSRRRVSARTARAYSSTLRMDEVFTRPHRQGQKRVSSGQHAKT